jgi:hypothetical protein
MPARRFLWAIVIIIVLVIAGAASYRLFGFQIMRILLVPRDVISAQAPPPAPDYAKVSSWQARPDIKDNPALFAPNGYAVAPKPGVALFFVTPTGFINRSHWNAPVDDKDMNKLLDMMLRAQGSVFNGVAAIYAPRYRQATFGAFLTDRPDAQIALDLAYSDVLRAFDAFIAQIPADQPIILAGHSQGALHLMRLMKERVAGTPLANRIVAAYVIGWPVSEQADLPAMGLPACTAPEQAGCVLSWQSFADPAETQDLRAMFDRGTGLAGKPRVGTTMLCTNPLLGRATNDVALPARNLGALEPDAAKDGKPLPGGTIGAACRADGYLDIGEPPAGFGMYVLPGNNYHVYDYSLFWANVRADAEARVDTFLSKALKQP